MRLNTLTARPGAPTGNRITWEFDIEATVSAAEEKELEWVLEIEYTSIGHRVHTVGGQTYTTWPDHKYGMIVITPGQKPPGGMGTLWRTTFSHTFNKTDILVENRDSYIFIGTLIPLVLLNRSNPKSNTFVGDID